MAPSEAVEPAQPAEEEELPDWINSIGTGALSASAISSSNSQPDWLTGLDQPAPSQPASDDQMDWMKGMDQPASSQPVLDDQPDWTKALDQPSESQPVPDNQPDWMKDFDQPKVSQAASDDQSAPSRPAPDDQPEWMKGFDQPAGSQPLPDDQPDWMTGFDHPAESQLTSASDDQLDWLKGVGSEAEPAPATSAMEQPDWLTQFGDQPKESAPAENEFDFLDEPTEQPQQTAASVSSLVDTGNLGVSEQERDDSFAWLENLAAKQGATEGLLTKPEDRLEQEPEWVKQAKGTSVPVPDIQPPVQPVANIEELGKSEQERDDSFAWLENLAAKQGATEGLLTEPEERLEQEPEWVQQAKSVPQVPIQPPANIEELGKSEQERDDSFAWLENLAAKQGATEGLLTKPEERLEQEPEWVQQAKSAPQVPIPPPANIEELGKSEQERDDSFAWLENLAAKQGATEGLLTKPEERLEQEPEWVQQAKSAPQAPAQPPANIDEAGEREQELDDSFAAKQGVAEDLLTKPEERLEQEPEWVQPATSVPEAPMAETASMDDTTAWLRSLEEEESKPELVSRHDETAMWLKKLEEPEPAPIPEATSSDDIPEWLQGLEEEQPPVAESVVPAASSNAEEELDWLNAIEEPVVAPTPEPEAENLPSWLKGMDEETKVSESIPQDALPAWMRDETGEVLVEPTRIEPTRPTEWQPITEKGPEPSASIVDEQSQSLPEPQPSQAPEIKPKPAPVKKPAPKPPAEPYQEPATRRGVGMLSMPIDSILESARTELSRSNIPGALESYGKLIKKGRFLDEVIFDLRDALYRYPVEVSIWQSLGDAYMRANRLQDALDAYTKAEELLR